MECVGRNPKNGKKKGGIKVHTVVNADEIVPSLVWFSEVKTHDHKFLEKLQCDENTIYVFDKGYNDYKAFEHFTSRKTGFVTRIKDNASYRKIEDLAMQSKDKFQEYFDTNLENGLLTVNDFKQGKLYKNDILFINWQKLVASKKDNRLLRRPDEEVNLKEQGYYFDDIIENTHKENREFVLIIDESHKNRDTDLAQEVIDVIKPKVILNVSATPKNIPGIDEIEEGTAGYVGVKRENDSDNEKYHDLNNWIVLHNISLLPRRRI